MHIIEPKIKAYIDAQLRRIFKWTSAYKLIKSKAWISGNIYKCANGCFISKNGLDEREEIVYDGNTYKVFHEKLAVDHINPVVSEKFLTTNKVWMRTTIERVMQPLEGLQYLCQSCHYIKTQMENQERNELKKGVRK